MHPQFQARFGKMASLENRINLCFTHSLAGREVLVDSKKMTAIVAYIEFLSRGGPRGAKIIGEKEMVVEESKREANLVRGEVVYQQQCVACHGDHGQRVGAASKHTVAVTAGWFGRLGWLLQLFGGRPLPWLQAVPWR